MARKKRKRTEEAITHSHIVDAAIACFERYDEKRTSMTDIADQANVGRQTLYRLFENRELLLKAVIYRLSDRQVELIEPKVSAAKTFERSIIVGCLEAKWAMDAMPVMAQCQKALGAEVTEKLVMLDTPTIVNVKRIYEKAIKRARDKGELRDELSDDDIARWILNIHYLFSLRTELDDAGRQEIVEKFVVPALVKPI